MGPAEDAALPDLAVLSPVRRDGRVVDLLVEAVSDSAWTSLAGPTGLAGLAELAELAAPAAGQDGAGAGRAVGRLLSEVLPAVVADGGLSRLCGVAETGEAMVLTRPAAQGDPRPARRVVVQRGTDGRVLLATRSLSESEQRREADDQDGPRWRRAVTEAPVGIGVAAHDGRIIEANPALCAMFARSREELVGRTLNSLSHPDDAARRLDRPVLERDGRVELRKRVLTGDGRTRWLRFVVAGVVEDGERRLLLVAEDITESVRAQGELTRLAFTDPLTGLSNRVDLRRRLARALRGAQEGGPVPALLLLGLDRFGVVNDSLGHDTGDRVLRAVATTVVDVVGTAGVCARLGGDEFAVLLHDPHRTPSVRAALQAAVSRPTRVAGREVGLSASIGEVLADPASDDGSLLRDADTAMHAAKRAGGDRCVVFDDALRRRALARLDVEADLRRGLDAGEVVAHHQPITTPAGGLRGTEALVRWHHPTRGLLAPAAFLDVAEETGLVVPLGQLVLRAACADAARWRRLRPGLAVSVNVAARHLASGHLVDDVVSCLEAAGLPGEALTLEVTETALLVHDEVVAAALEAVRALGCHVALDDFGTGYSSLAHLRDYPVDVLKVDRSFVAAAPGSADATRLLRGICSLGRGLGLTVVAEGVEDELVRTAAVTAGADLLQGYLVGRPAPAGAIDDALSGRVGAAR